MFSLIRRFSSISIVYRYIVCYMLSYGCYMLYVVVCILDFVFDLECRVRSPLRFG